jgi:hypothetical protein
MAPYLLHCEIMRRAKALGHEWYDFWGVAPENETDHRRQNISVFKRKFGGLELNLVPTLDYVYDPETCDHYLPQRVLLTMIDGRRSDAEGLFRSETEQSHVRASAVATNRRQVCADEAIIRRGDRFCFGITQFPSANLRARLSTRRQGVLR